ncbi:hypothetical protein LEP1GSC040_4011 [Leptospira santarosai str. 2000030832]|nr:hypothetical protein LEP1GSC040_4011 [Leptospira santarosai str. 2000030832]
MEISKTFLFYPHEVAHIVQHRSGVIPWTCPTNYVSLSSFCRFERIFLTMKLARMSVEL